METRAFWASTGKSRAALRQLLSPVSLSTRHRKITANRATGGLHLGGRWPTFVTSLVCSAVPPVCPLLEGQALGLPGGGTDRCLTCRRSGGNCWDISVKGRLGAQRPLHWGGCSGVPVPGHSRAALSVTFPCFSQLHHLAVVSTPLFQVSPPPCGLAADHGLHSWWLQCGLGLCLCALCTSLTHCPRRPYCPPVAVL